MTGQRVAGASLRIEPRKSAPMRLSIAAAPAPAQAVLSLDQGWGCVGEAVVRPGDRVLRGTLVAVALDETDACLHSPIAGRVVEVASRPVAQQPGLGTCIVIENDGSEQWDPAVAPPGDFSQQSPGELIGRLRSAGIVGLGGAAFPTATKLEAARRSEGAQLVLNGAECEPWICCDDALMRERAADVILGARAICHATGASRCTIAIEEDKPEALEALRAAAASSGAPEPDFVELPTLYPSGAEQTLLAAVTGVEVPRGRLPTDAGLLCHNVGTAAAIARYLRTGEPLTSRILTVTGSGVRQPRNLEARIGTPIAVLVEACGGYAGEPQRLIAGGGMTGQALGSDAVPVTKGINCIVVATAGDLGPREPELPCIRCGDCAAVCPARLLPQQLYRAVLAGDRELLDRHGLLDCIECGCCDYVCPSRIRLTERFHAAKLDERLRHAERQLAEAARQRHELRDRRLTRDAEAEREAFERARRQARGGQVDEDGPDAV
jgi:electron transport complex protein RnfC